VCEIDIFKVMLSANVILIFAIGWLVLLYQKKSRQLALIEKQNKEQEKTLFFQSRYERISGMLSSIIHQWREPLGAVGAIQSGITARIMFGQAIDNDFLLESAQTSTKILRHLSETIETFHGFIKNKNEDKNTFSIKSTLETIKKIMAYSLERNGITLACTIDGDYVLQGCENEFSQVLINIISNDKDILAQTHTKEHRTIEVSIGGSEKRCIIVIKDNAGGVKMKPIEKIFEPSTSSKNGSGIGLYISKNIIENKFYGKISVSNDEYGAVFTIEVPGEKTTDKTNGINKEINGKTKMISQIVELENAEKEMQKWAEIFSKAHWGIEVKKGRSAHIEMANPAFAAMHGYTQEEIHLIESLNFIAPKYRHEFTQKIEEAYKDGFVSFDSVRLRKDGSMFDAHIDLTAVIDSNEEALYYIANIRDITEEKRQKNMLDIVSYAVNHVADAIFLVDKDARFHWVNAVACNSLGYTQDELLQMRIWDIHKEHTMDKWPAYLEAIQTIKKVTFIGKHTRKDGSMYPTEANIHYFEYEGVGYSLGIVKDITGQKAVDQKLQKTILSLKHFASAIPGVLYIYTIYSDGSGALSYASEKLYEIIGINNSDSPAAAEIIASHCLCMQESSEFSIFHPTKGERKIKSYAIPQSQENNETLWYGVLFDITENR